MKKRVIVILIFCLFLIAAGIIYLNHIILPTKIKSLILQDLQEATQNKVDLGTLRFNIFKGLVLKDLVLYEGTRPLVNIKEASAGFLIWPVFKKIIIVPTLNIKSPSIYLERRKDNTFNIQDLFIQRKFMPKKKAWNIFVRKVSIRDANIRFQDNTFATPFTKNIVNLNSDLYLSLPTSVKFNLKAEVPFGSSIKINALGEYKIVAQEAAARISLHGLSPKEFPAYYQNLGVSIPEGFINALINLRLKGNTLRLVLEAENKNLNISKGRVSYKLNANLKADFAYDFKSKQLKYSGKAKIIDSQISGLEFVDTINNMNTEVAFNNSGLFADKLSAKVLGIPIEAKASLNDFNNPVFKISTITNLSLAPVLGILKDRFKFVFPGELKGEAGLSFSLQHKIPSQDAWELKSSLDILNGRAKFKRINSPFENIRGRIEFSSNQVKWQELKFDYTGTPYQARGALTNFQAPEVEIELSSKDLFLQSNFNINNKLIRLSRLAGHYLNSEFLVTGDIDTQEQPRLKTDLAGRLNIDLKDIKKYLKKFDKQLEQIKPDGVVSAQVGLSGDLNNFKSCAIQAKLSSPFISAFGLKSKDFNLHYNQENGIVDIPSISLSLYDGTIKASASININSTGLPYWTTLDAQGIKIEKLKVDTGARERDIAGTITAQAKLNGFSEDPSRLSGAGQIFITDGRLWEINLFKGFGSLVLAKDFSNIIFQEGYCGFTVQDKYILTQNLTLKSDIANLSGSLKIGFDGSLDGSLNVQILDEFVPLTGTFRDVTTAIIGQSGRFGVIRISGTLKEPKYKFKTAVVDIFKGLKNTFLKKTD